jgi:hypothetical protein
VHDSWPRAGPVHVSIRPPFKFSAHMTYEEAALRIEQAVRE